jgi:integrase
MLPTGLHRHSKYGTYYLRRRIPNDLLPCYPGKVEITYALRTKDYRTAVELHRLGEARLTRDWVQLRLRQSALAESQEIQTRTRIDRLTPEDIDAICAHFEAASLAGDEQRRGSEAPYTIEEVEEYQAAYTEANLFLKAAVATGDVRCLRGPLDQFLHLYGYTVDASEDDMRRLTLAYGRAAIRTNQKLLSRYEGEDVPTPVPTAKAGTPMLSEVTKAYLAHYEKLGQDAMLKKVRSALPLLAEIIGDKPIASLKQSDLELYFETVQNLPPRWKDLCRQRAITASALAAEAVGQISKGTFDGTYLAVVAPFVAHARRVWQDRGWPSTLTADGIKYTGSRKDPEHGQRHFKQEELARLFEGAEMAAIARDPSEAHKFWLPHVGLFTGARVNELCQLNPQIDIRQDAGSGVWFFDITDKSEAHAELKKSVKTKGSKRQVPVHPQLLKLGFLDYLEHVKESGHKILFPGFPPSVGRASPKASKWFGGFLAELQLRDQTPGARLVGMHAFRSTLLNRAQALQVVDAEAITGHKVNVTRLEKVKDGHVGERPTEVMRTYQGDLPVQIGMEILERITYGDLAFHTPVTPGRRSFQ